MFKPLRILVVDDDPPAACRVAAQLSTAGHETRTAHNAAEGAQTLEAWRPDVVLLDYRMEGLDDPGVLGTYCNRTGAREIPVLTFPGDLTSTECDPKLDPASAYALLMPSEFRMVAATLDGANAQDPHPAGAIGGP